MSKETGNKSAPDAYGIWPHERRCAQSLSASGRDVKFIPVTQGSKVKSADLVMDGMIWEMKPPETSDVHSLQRIVRRASRQSHNVIIDTSRATRLSDAKIEHELRRLLHLVKSVKRLLMVAKTGEVIDLTC